MALYMLHLDASGHVSSSIDRIEHCRRRFIPNNNNNNNITSSFFLLFSHWISWTTAIGCWDESGRKYRSKSVTKAFAIKTNALKTNQKHKI